MIEVSDGLTPTLTGTTLVEVTVTGNNDAAPAFTAVTATNPTVSHCSCQGCDIANPFDMYL